MDAFTAVVDELFGESVDPRELRDLVSKQGDASEMHVPAALEARRRKRSKVVNTVGQGLNGLAIVAGSHALVMAGRDERLFKPGRAAAQQRKITPARIASAPYRTYAKTKLYGKIGPKSVRAAKYAVPLAGGALALHGAEIVGDSIAAHALHSQRKQVAKSLVDELVAAFREGQITGDQAAAIAGRVVEKAQSKDANKIFAAVDAIAPAIPGKKAQLANSGLTTARTGANQIASVVRPKKKRLAFAKRPEAVPLMDAPVAKGMDDVVWSGEISKRNDEQQQVFGFCTVTHVNGEPVVDLQNDYIPLDEIEKSAYTYVLESRKGGDQHERNGELPMHKSDMIESFVITPEKLEQMGLEKDALPYGWWVGFKVNDTDLWEGVKKNHRTGFSIHGVGKRRERTM